MRRNGRLKKLLCLILAMLVSISSLSLAGAVTALAETVYDLYLRGGFNGWNNPAEDKFIYRGNGIYTLVKSLTGGTYEYKIATQDWSTQLGGSGGSNLTITLEEDSIVKFTANMNSRTQSYEILNTKVDYTLGSSAVTIEAEKFTYILGEAFSWPAAEPSNGHYLGGFDEGDSVNYGVSVSGSTARTYIFKIFVASETDNGKFNFITGTEKTEGAFSSTGAWQRYKTVVFTKTLKPGYNRIAIENTDGTWNVDKIEIVPTTNYATTLSNTTNISLSDYDSVSDTAIVTSSAIKTSKAGEFVSYIVKPQTSGVYKVSFNAPAATSYEVGVLGGEMKQITREAPSAYLVIDGETEVIVRTTANKSTNISSIKFEYTKNVEAMGQAFANCGDASKINDGTAASWTAEVGCGDYFGLRFANTFEISEITLETDNIKSGVITYSDGTRVVVSFEDGVAKTISNPSTVKTSLIKFEITEVYSMQKKATVTEMTVSGKKVENSATDIALKGYVRANKGWVPAKEEAFNAISTDSGHYGIGFPREITVNKVVIVSEFIDQLPTKVKVTTADNKTQTVTGTKNGMGLELDLGNAYSFGFYFDLGQAATVNMIQVYGSTEYKGSSTNISREYDYDMFVNGITENDSRVIANDGTHILTNETGSDREWTLTTDISSAPSFSAPNTPLAEAAYNLTMEEVFKSINHDAKFGDVFYTGTNWQKVWTRDTAISMQYILSWLFPDISTNCAKAKVVGENGTLTFEEDTGTGGSYPVSTDRIIMMLAVWETYLANGDKDTLSYFYDIASNTIKQDYNVVFDKESGLFRGETCGLDHRDKTYPDWTSEAERESLAKIAEGKATSTNVIYCEVMNILSKSALILNKGESESKAWSKLSADLKSAISDRLWHDDLNMYASWEYPDFMGSPLPYKADVLGNGYAVWFGVGSDEQINSIMENYPLVNYGANTVYPQKQASHSWSNKVYHDSGVWPGWEAILMIGANYQGNEKLAEEIWNSCIRGAAACLTNYEVINYKTGEGCESTQQLWSIAGTLSGYYRVLFGMNYTEEGIEFDPYIPEWMEAPFTIEGLKYRDAELTLNLYGEGDTVDSIYVNGQQVANDYVLPADSKGSFNITITLKDSGNTDKVSLKAENLGVAPSCPTMSYSNGTLRWAAKSDCTYKLWNGKKYIDVTGNSYKPDTSKYGCYSLVAVSKSTGLWSDLSSPIVVNGNENIIKIEAESGKYSSSQLKTDISGYSGKGFITDNKSSSSPVTVTVDIGKEGIYQFSCVYTNRGETNSSVHCAIRSVYVDGVDVGALVFPVMNYDWQTSTHLRLALTEGTHEITVKYDTDNWYDRNMAISQNNVNYDYFRLELQRLGLDPEPTTAPTDPDITTVPTDPELKVLLGDVNGDNSVNVKDATLVQKSVAGLAVLDDEATLCADADLNGSVNVKDATTIQKYVAGMNVATPVGELITV